MSIIAELRFPSDEFVLARTMATHPEVVFEFEQLVPTTGRLLPYLWASDGDLDVDEIVAADPTLDDVSLVDDLEEGGLFRVEWADTGGSFVDGFANGDEAILQAVGRDGEWFCKLRFESRRSISDFQTYCSDRDVSFTLLRLNDTQVPKLAQFDMTTAQRDAIVVALQMGYFSVPRECELSDVAEALDLSPNAVSERIRRGEANLFRSALTIDHSPQQIYHG